MADSAFEFPVFMNNRVSIYVFCSYAELLEKTFTSNEHLIAVISAINKTQDDTVFIPIGIIIPVLENLYNLQFTRFQ